MFADKSDQYSLTLAVLFATLLLWEVPHYLDISLISHREKVKTLQLLDLQNYHFFLKIKLVFTIVFLQFYEQKHCRFMINALFIFYTFNMVFFSLLVSYMQNLQTSFLVPFSFPVQFPFLISGNIDSLNE